MSDDVLETRCCVVGGGPAGMMLGYLLGRAGVKTVVLEKHADFLRDFRGDTVHPSTLMIMQELGLAEEFLKLPHSEIRALSLEIGDILLLRFGWVGWYERTDEATRRSMAFHYFSRECAALQDIKRLGRSFYVTKPVADAH